MKIKLIAFWAGLLTLLAIVLMIMPFTFPAGLIMVGLMILFWTGVFPWLVYKNTQGDKRWLWQIIASLSALLSLLIIAFYIVLIIFAIGFEG